MFEQFHFQQPLWLIATIPLLIIAWLLTNRTNSAKSWEKVIDANLLPIMLQGKNNETHHIAKWLLGTAWLIAVTALADPVWQKIPRPIFQTNTARVIVLDLSNSMLIDDLKPTRMARARFKIEDILAKQEEGQIGLVVFAGDAFTATPLTRDGETIRALLQVLTPRIMPSQGSRADLGLMRAHELLKQAGVKNGQVLLITDGTSNLGATLKVASALNADKHTLSVLAVGTEEGGTLKFSKEQEVTVTLDIDSLRQMAKKGGGVLHSITNSDTDLQAVLKQTNLIDTKHNPKNEKGIEKAANLNSFDWKSTGPFIILLLLPLAALAFRKGWLFSLLISVSLATSISLPDQAMAASEDSKAIQTLISENTESTWTNFFKDLLKNKEQRAESAFQNQQYGKVRELTKNPLRAGSAAYKDGDYEQALETFKTSKGATARYNEGNTLAKLKKYQDAIKAYDEALQQQPDMADAKKNKKTLEDFLKQQEQHKPENKESDNNSDENSNNKQDQKNQQQNKDSKNNSNKQAKKNNSQKGEKSDESKNGDLQQDNKGGKDQDGKQNQFSEANEEMDKKSDEKNDLKNSTDKETEKKSQNVSDAKQDSAGDKQDSTKTNSDKSQQAIKENGTKAQAEELNKEEKMAAEQWLRRIPDDPGGLLRRKFKRQYRLRKRPSTNENPW